jgi:hypothetical protein
MGRLSVVVVALVIGTSAARAETIIGLEHRTSVGFAQSPPPAAPGSLGTLPPGLTDALPPSPADIGRDTDRYMIGVGFGVFANYPVSIEDPGAALLATRPLWLGNRYSFFQWVAEANALVGFGTDQLHAYVAVGPTFGWNFYFGSVFGLEFRYGIDALAQVGERTVGGVGFSGAGGYVFRLWDDDRQRIKLWLQMHMGFFFADDPQNDIGMNAGSMVVGVGYEQPM